MTVLSEQTIRARELVRTRSGFRDIAYQPAGVDLRVAHVSQILGPGYLNADGSKVLPERVYLPPQVLFDEHQARWYLNLGNYSCEMCEEVHMPTDLVAFLWSRSSLCRMGCWVETAVFDPGYVGSPGVLLRVENPAGIFLEQGTPIAQLVFHTLDQETRPYSGSYQGENLT